MKHLIFTLLALLSVASLVGTSYATTDATCLVYQPIDMRSEGTVIKLPQGGFIILAVPYLSGFTVSEKPYDAITRPYVMLSMRHRQGAPDSNLASRAGIKIQSQCFFEGSKLKKEVVTVNLSDFVAKNYELSLEVITEATLECIRRTATDERQKWLRPTIRIIGKPTDKAKWKVWEESFNKQDFSKPFKRPEASIK